MENDCKISYYKALEKRFSIFRSLLLVVVAPVSFTLSEFTGNKTGFSIVISLFLFYNIFVTIAAYSKKNRFSRMLSLTMYFDIPFISLILLSRGGLRSDIYFTYFLLILYDGAKFGLRGTISSLLQSLVYFSAISFFFTAPEYFSLGRYIIRALYIIIMTIVMYEINRQIDDSRAKEKIAKEQACQDPLTKLPNRLLLSEQYEVLKQSFENASEPFAIILLDVDNFKSLNDTNGHAFGDSILVALSKILKDNIAPDDFICRFGGDEFIIYFAKCSQKDAYSRADKIRNEIASCDFFGKSVTVSIGINMFRNNYSMIENISFADEAMYEAKQNGKNKVVIYQDISYVVAN